jgi:hypothetical protein
MGVAASRARHNTRMTCIAFKLPDRQESPMRREDELSALNARRSRRHSRSPQPAIRLSPYLHGA